MRPIGPTGSHSYWGNLGFAGGNNVGMRFALSQLGCEYISLLNNDTVVDPGALNAMVQKMETDLRFGICGSILRDYFSPNAIQTLGGRNMMLGAEGLAQYSLLQRRHAMRRPWIMSKVLQCL